MLLNYAYNKHTHTGSKPNCQKYDFWIERTSKSSFRKFDPKIIFSIIYVQGKVPENSNFHSYMCKVWQFFAITSRIESSVTSVSLTYTIVSCLLKITRVHSQCSKPSLMILNNSYYPLHQHTHTYVCRYIVDIYVLLYIIIHYHWMTINNLSIQQK